MCHSGESPDHHEFHSGDFTRQGGTLQMVQLWVNLRAQDKSAPPGYQTLLQGQIPNVSLPRGAGTVRVIAGEYGGRQGPAKTFTPISPWDVDLRAGGTAALPLPEGHTAMFLVLGGKVMIGGDREAGEGDLAIFDRSGDGIALRAKCDAKLLVIGGEPIAEPVVGRGPFDMNTQEEIQQAFEDHQLGRMGDLA